MRLKIQYLLPAFLLLLALPGTGNAFEPKKDQPEARRVMTMVDERDDGDNRTSDMTMVLLDKNGDKRVRILRSLMRDFGPAKQDTYKMMFFESPADVKDTAFLTYDYDGERDDDQWLYLPALRKTKRIASDDKSSAFMGSDFSYADMTKRELENYTFQMLGEKEVGGHKTLLIQSSPVSQAVVDKYGYTKSVLFVRPDINMVVRAVHWEDKPNRLKYFDVKKLEKINGIWTVLESHMTSRYGKRFLHKTVLTYANVRYDQDMDNAFFTVRTLERGI